MCLSDEAPEPGRQQFLGEKGFWKGGGIHGGKRFVPFLPVELQLENVPDRSVCSGLCPLGAPILGTLLCHRLPGCVHALSTQPVPLLSRLQPELWFWANVRSGMSPLELPPTPRRRRSLPPALACRAGPRAVSAPNLCANSGCVGSCCGINRWCILNIKTLKLFF